LEFSVEVGQSELISVEAAEISIRHIYEIVQSTKNFGYKGQEPGLEMYQ
jgi:hypothetical protein